MKILSIDTSSKICSVAILENKKLIKEISENNGYTHSETLMPLIEKLFSSQNLTLKNIDLIVCDKGPGSFTGIRIGVATAKAFQDSLNINAIGISSLEALAYNVKTDGIICPLIDAKNSNVYWAIFEKFDNKYLLKHEFLATNIEEIFPELNNLKSSITFVGDASTIHKNLILKHLPNSKFENQNDLSAFSLGLAGFNHFAAGITDDLLPLYLRKPQAERMLEKNNDK